MQFQAMSQVQQLLKLLPLIKNSVLFKDLTEAELKTVYLAASLKHYKKDSFLFYEDEPANSIFMLVQGAIHLCQLTAKGQQVIIHYLSPGDEIGILALFPDQVYPVTAVAATDCCTISWSNHTLSALIQQFPQLALNALQMMTERFVTLQNQYRQLATERVELRIARTVMQIAEKTGQTVKNGIRLTPPPSRQQIAEMTGATLYTVSRICSQWEKNGLVQTNRRWLLIKDTAALTRIVEEGNTPV
jgi:CRP-like cAMP-binding protein